MEGRAARGEGTASAKGLEHQTKIAIFRSGVGASLTARPRFLEPELDPDLELPARPGPLHI